LLNGADLPSSGRELASWQLLQREGIAGPGWRWVNAPRLAGFVRTGATVVDGVKVEREDTRDVA
jgi:hypothetical protein